MTIEATELPGATDTGVIATQTEQPDAAPLSLKEHATLYSEKADTLPEDKKAKLEAKAEQHHAAQQKREKDGTFTEGKTRHRAQSQQARPEDVPRIKALTAEKNSALERLAAAEAEVSRLRTQHAPPAQVAAAERKVEQAEATVERTPAPKNDPEPTEDDPKYAADYAKFLQDHTRWAVRDENRQLKAAEAREADQAKRQEAKSATIRTFAERLTAAKDKYDDFEATLQWDAPWLAQSGDPHPGYEALHEFILSDESGADVLHYLRSHSDEVDALLRVPPLQQVKRLTLLGQRFASPESTAAGSSSAAPRPTIVKLAPKPPTLERTGTQKVVGAPPTDGTLSVLGHAKAFKYQR